MIAQWMFGAIAFSLLCAIAAWGAERALRTWQRSARWPWVVAMLASTVWPLVAPLVLTPAESATATQNASEATVGSLTAVAEADSAVNIAEWFAQHDAVLLSLWAGVTLLLLIQVMFAIRTLRAIQRRATSQNVDGETVLIDDAVGPAVIGLLHPRIVLPTWLLSLDHSLRTLVLRHEREHCRAGDPRLVWMAVATTTLMPWNVALWWIAHRLRLAMEIDCDARTAHTSDERTRYAKLLLLIAQQKQSARFAPMLSESPSQLSRRIRAMNQSKSRYPLLRAGAAAVVVIAAGIAACSPRIATNLTSPTPLNGPAQASTPSAEVAEVTTPGARPVVAPPFFDFQVDKPAVIRPGERGPAYPADLRAAGVQGTVLAQFVVGTDGSIDPATFKVLKSDHVGLTEAVRSGVGTMRFLPALKSQQPVRQLVQLPFQFAVDTGANGKKSYIMSMHRPADSTSREAVARARARAAMAVPGGAATQTVTDSSRPMVEFQTERPAQMRAGSAGPKYPQGLRDSGVQGQVMAQFIVNADGSVDMRSFKVLKSDHPEFTEAVKTALTTMQFEPALVKGAPVRQLMQQPFAFSLNK